MTGTVQCAIQSGLRIGRDYELHSLNGQAERLAPGTLQLEPTQAMLCTILEAKKEA